MLFMMRDDHLLRTGRHQPTHLTQEEAFNEILFMQKGGACCILKRPTVNAWVC